MGKLFNRAKDFFADEEFDDDEDDELDIEPEADEDIDDEENFEAEDDIEDENDEADDDIDEEDDGEDGDEEDYDDEDGDEEDNDDDDEDDDEIEDDEEELEDDEEEDDEEDRREYRRKRRIRNQIIAYGVVGLLAAILVGIGIFVGHHISVSVKEKRLAQEQAEQLVQQQEPEDLVIEAPPVIEEVTYDEQLEEIVNSCISEMPLEDKVAGLFIVTPESLTGVGTVTQAGEGTQNALNEYAVGGFIYFSKNIIDKEQLIEMLSNTTPKSKYPIFLAVDEEGGEVSRVASSDIEVIQVDDMATIGSNGDTTAAYEAGVTIGSYLNELGFNLNFAPVADIASADSAVLGNRSFGDDATIVADMTGNIIEGMEGTGISACMKHFPGIGSTDGDTHDGRVEITKSLDEMRTSDFLPFEAGIESGVDCIMVSHAIATGIDTEGLPSSLSEQVITTVLRGELGYDGVVITDALNMGAITEYYTSEEAAVMAIEAGADMLLMPEDFEAAYNAVLTAVQDGTISEERINESLRRIYRIKYADKLE